MVPAIVLYVLLPSFQAWAWIHGQGFDPWEAIDASASILAFHWVAANTILASRVPWFQSWLPHDRRLRLHILSSIGLVVAVAWHGGYKILAGYEIDPVSWSLLAVFATTLGAAFLWIPVPPLDRLRAAVLRAVAKLRGLSYDAHKTFHHRALVFLVGLVLLHVGRSDMLPDLHPAALAGYALLAAGMLLYFFAGRSGLFRSRAVVDSVRLEGDVAVVELRPAKPGRHRGGQFLYVGRKDARGKSESHPFSIVSAASEPVVRFAARGLGDFSRGLARLKPGEELEISHAFGDFGPRDGEEPVFVGTGIGVAPFVGILEEWRARGDDRRVDLLVAGPTESEIPLLGRLRELAVALPNLHLTVLETSRTRERFTADTLWRLVPNTACRRYYLCASPPVRRGLVDALRSLGVPRRAIVFESFSFAG